MTIHFTDETLSAFLDGELPQAQMESMREAIAGDAALAARLATLAQVNVLVKKQAHAIDHRPMPAAVLALLANTATTGVPATAKIIEGPWRRHRAALMALAASLLVAMGIAISYRGGDNGLPALPQYATLLDQTSSGTAVMVGDAELLTRFSFRNRQSQYCRQYQLRNAATRSENIACRDREQWTITGSMILPLAAAGEFQPAAVPAELESMLHAQMQGSALDLATENRVIGNEWRDVPLQ